MLHPGTKSYETDMCSGPLLPGLLRFTLPLTLSTMLQLLFNAADVVVVGRYAGDNSLAAVGSNTALIALLTNLFIGLAVGANILAARHYGAGDRESTHRTVHTAMLLSVFCGLFLSLLGILGAEQLLTWMQCPPEVLSLATLYLRIYFVGMTATMLYNFGAALLRSIGDTRRPLYYLSAAGVVNVALNLFFVIRLNMDVAGVALATVISQCISAFLVVRCLLRETSAVRLELRALRIYRPQLLQILRIGLPAGMQGVLFSLSNVVIQSSVNSFGETVMAGNAAASNIEGFVYASILAFSQASAAFTSQNLGAGNIRRIWRVSWLSLLCGFLCSLLLSMLALALGETLLGIYSPNSAVVAAGMVRMCIICATFSLDSLMDVIVGSMRGMGYNILPTAVTLLGACAFRLVWLATVFQLPGRHTIETVYLVYPISWVLTFLAHLVCFLLLYRRLRRRHLETETVIPTP